MSPGEAVSLRLLFPNATFAWVLGTYLSATSMQFKSCKIYDIICCRFLWGAELLSPPQLCSHIVLSGQCVEFSHLKNSLKIASSDRINPMSVVEILQ